ncbi:hypothetical protein PTSG_10692 [Salpingoeca rosetta]|uniref:Actin n=1 Tax=Salpingoeca rosetta (strain ATCC 50818 / BSB-021) TaxID=946362 RepID=F2UQ39_SALR5|nr:uncharacterized protein PTSG_10692 [Salpingoeca rosetta]EGD79707.1 hypothetical protein PTSG_10692 [Salpingoeca rosetta]|eukprot:XP_004988657.1 hypothetical protein PTSG_10692 [Salpingoeca rosetta]
MNVKELVGRLEAEKLREEQEQLERARQEAEQARLLQLAAEEEARIAAEEAEKNRQEELEKEKARWHVSEDESHEEVERMKRQLLQQIEKPKPKPVVKLEDIRTIVIDIGSGSIKAGFAGEDAPRVVMSAIVGFIKDVSAMDLEKHAHVDRDVYFGDEAWVYADVLEIKRVISRGVIQDHVLFERLIKHLLVEELKIPPNELRDHPVLVTEPPLNPKRCSSPTPPSSSSSRTGGVTGVVDDVYYEAISVAVGLMVVGTDLDRRLAQLMADRGYTLSPGPPV